MYELPYSNPGPRDRKHETRETGQVRQETETADMRQKKGDGTERRELEMVLLRHIRKI